MKKLLAILLAPLAVSMLLFVPAAHSAEAGGAADAAAEATGEPPYEKKEALKTIINPHDQINDEGDVLWARCIICHKEVPDVGKDKGIENVKLRYKEELKDLCYRCHPIRKHPGTEGISVAMSGYAAPDHLVVPSRDIYLNMRLSMKEVYTMMPLDPDNEKITCVTCHNPHERGVLFGRADWGADSTMRLRSEGLDICQYCHRK